MASTARVKIHSPAIRSMLQSDGVREGALRPVAESVLANMEANCPRESGTLQASLQIWDDTTDRAVERVGSDVEYAPLVAARTGFMLRALDAGGG